MWRHLCFPTPIYFASFVKPATEIIGMLAALASRRIYGSNLRRIIKLGTADYHLPTTVVPPFRYTQQTRTLSTAFASEDDADMDMGDMPDFGSYSIILPPEPFVYGTEHIKSRGVSHELHGRMPSYSSYQSGKTSDETTPEVPTKGVPDITTAEGLKRLRKAAHIARDVLEFAGQFARVSSNVHAFPTLRHPTKR
jgi:hypothetical protein